MARAETNLTAGEPTEPGSQPESFGRTPAKHANEREFERLRKDSGVHRIAPSSVNPSTASFIGENARHSRATELFRPEHASVVLRILVVDGHSEFRESLIAWIGRKPNYLVCGSAGSPIQALQETARKRPHLVLLDHQLCNGTGFELIRLLGKTECHPLVIVLSQRDEPSCADRSIQAGARGYVLKAEAVDVIHASIREVLEGRIYLGDAMRHLV